ncbi:LOW QUALITY PROTEIN: TIP20 Protein transport protein TIP20 [Candida maltosa Xu316]
MDVDYINSNFTTLDDLSSVHEKLTELQNLQLEIKKLSESKVKDTDASEHLSTTTTPEKKIYKINQEKLDNAIDELIYDVGLLSDIPDDQVISVMDHLIEKHGQLPVLIDLKGQFETKLDTIKTIEMLEKSKRIDEDLNRDLSLSELKEISQEIASDDCEELTIKLNTIFDSRKQQLESDFKHTLKENKWLSNDSIPNSALTLIGKQFNDLIILQSIISIPKYPDSWWGLDLLLEPFVTRFNYHFSSSNKDTNKLSKPEWAFDYLETFLSDNLPLLGIIVDDVFKSVDKIGTYEIITCLLIPVRKKVEKMIEQINNRVTNDQEGKLVEKNGRLLSHLIFELSSFDQRIKEKYKYNPYIVQFDEVPSEKWLGITSDILLNDSNHAVKNWLDFENQLAAKRFQNEIIQSKDAFKIDYDYQGNSSEQDHRQIINYHILKPTYSAYGLVKLIDNLNSHFQTLSIVKFQLQYVSRIQMTIIDKYFDVLNNRYKLFNDNLKSMLNMLPGSFANETKTPNSVDLQDSLMMLTEIYCSSKFINNALENWSDQLIFIQLWTTYTGLLTSDPLEDKSIFDASVKHYDELINKVIKSYEDFFRIEIKRLLKTYVNTSIWELETNSKDGEEEEEGLEPSTHLGLLVGKLAEYLETLSKSLSNLDYFMISDKVVSILCDILFEYVLTNNEFNRAGVNQLITDFEYMVKSLQYPLHFNADEGAEYSNDHNDKYLKIVQALDLMESIDPSVIREYKRKSDKLDAKFIEDVRTKYTHRLKELNNYDINNLLIRIE